MKILPFSPDRGFEWAKTIDFLTFSPDWPIFHKPLEPSLWFVGMVGLVGLVGQVGRSGVGGEVGKWGWVDGKASLSGRGSEAYRELVEFSLWIIC